MIALALLAVLPYQLEWRDLPRLVEGRKVAVTLRDGATVKGRAAGITGEALTVATSKGPRQLARPTVSQIRVSRSSGHTWRVVGAAILGGIGAAVGIPLWFATYEVAAVPASIGAGIGLGYLLGWGADVQTIRIEVVTGP